MHANIEKQLRELWDMVRHAPAPHSNLAPNLVNDIEEFLEAGEWELALEHMLDYAAATKKHPDVEMQAARIQAEMKRLSSK